MKETDRVIGMNKKPSPPLGESLALMGQLGFVIVIPIVLGAILGSFLDGKFHTSPILILVGLLLGLISGIFGAYRLFSRAIKDR